MTISQLDDHGALIIHDQQNYNRLLEVDYVLPLEDVIDRTVQLAGAFRRRGWPIVHLKVPNEFGVRILDEGGQPGGRVELGYVRARRWSENWHDIIPELTPQPEDLVVTKPIWDGFVGTTLDYELRQRGVTQVFLVGLMTAKGVESTGRTAWNFGYNLVSITDAMTDFDRDAHTNSVEKIFPRIGERATTAEGIELIAPVTA